MPEHFNLAVFEVECTVPDVPTDRRRWNGGPMASAEASAALQNAVEAFQESLRRDGFPIIHTGHGVRAESSAMRQTPDGKGACLHPVVRTMVGGADVCQSCGTRW